MTRNLQVGDSFLPEGISHPETRSLNRRATHALEVVEKCV